MSKSCWNAVWFSSCVSLTPRLWLRNQTAKERKEMRLLHRRPKAVPSEICYQQGVMFRICCGQSEASLSSKKAKEEHWELGAEMPCAFFFVEHLCVWTVLNTPCRLTAICGRVTRFFGFLGYMLVFESCKIQGGKWWKSRIKEWRDGLGRFWAWLQVAQVVVASSRNHLFVFSDTGAQMGMQPLLLTAVRELEGVERQKAWPNKQEQRGSAESEKTRGEKGNQRAD